MSDGALELFPLAWAIVTNLIGMVLVMVIKPKGRNRFGKPGAPRGPMGAIQNGFNMYAAANGRASRSEFWWFFLFTIIITLLLSLLDDMAKANIFRYGQYGLLLPMLTVQIRRLHDINRSGWWVLLGVSIIPVTLWVLCARKANQDEAEHAASAF